jgi:hypothetical protein
MERVLQQNEGESVCGTQPIASMSGTLGQAYIPQPKGSVIGKVATMTDLRAALAKRLGLAATVGAANTNGTVEAAE